MNLPNESSNRRFWPKRPRSIFAKMPRQNDRKRPKFFLWLLVSLSNDCKPTANNRETAASDL